MTGPGFPISSMAVGTNHKLQFIRVCEKLGSWSQRHLPMKKETSLKARKKCVYNYVKENHLVVRRKDSGSFSYTDIANDENLARWAKHKNLNVYIEYISVEYTTRLSG